MPENHQSTSTINHSYNAELTQSVGVPMNSISIFYQPLIAYWTSQSQKTYFAPLRLRSVLRLNVHTLCCKRWASIVYQPRQNHHHAHQYSIVFLCCPVSVKSIIRANAGRKTPFLVTRIPRFNLTALLHYSIAIPTAHIIGTRRAKRLSYEDQTDKGIEPNPLTFVKTFNARFTQGAPCQLPTFAISGNTGLSHTHHIKMHQSTISLTRHCSCFLLNEQYHLRIEREPHFFSTLDRLCLIKTQER